MLSCLLLGSETTKPSTPMYETSLLLCRSDRCKADFPMRILFRLLLSSPPPSSAPHTFSSFLEGTLAVMPPTSVETITAPTSSAAATPTACAHMHDTLTLGPASRSPCVTARKGSCGAPRPCPGTLRRGGQRRRRALQQAQKMRPPRRCLPPQLPEEA